MKKRKLILTLTLLTGLVSMSFSDPMKICIVSSNPENNIGFCRPDSEGLDNCFTTGSGVECMGDIIIPT